MSAVRKCPQCRGRVTEPARCINGHDQADDPYDRLAAILGEHIDYDRLAELVAARLHAFVTDLAAQVPEPGQLVDARAIARMTGKRREWVYRHREQLGGVPLGTGPRPRWGFDPDLVRARLEQRNGDATAPQAPNTPPPRQPPPAELLPVKDRAA